MPINYAGSRQPRGIPSELTASRAKADGDLVGDMAGTAFWLEQWVYDEQGTSASPIAPPTPLNGTRYMGHDHSGGLMGLPQKHSIWSHSWGYLDGGDVTDNQPPQVNSFTDILIDARVGPVWCPPGYIYTRGVRGHVTLYCQGDDVNVDVEFKGEGGSKADKTNHQITVNTITHISTDGLFFLRPGGFSMPILRIKITNWRTASYLYLLSASIDQVYDEAIPATGSIP